MKDYNEWLSLYTDFLNANEITEEPYRLYGPVNYFMGIGGKRFRPVLLLMTYELYRADYEFALPLAHAMEVFHNFTLVHDDIMDEADKRRGRETVHIKYGVPTAILSGDVMLLHTYKLMDCYRGHAGFSEIISYYTHIGIDICRGQQWDMEFEQEDEIEPESYVRMIKYKTAILLGASMKLGALIANANDTDQYHLEQFAVNLGIAFQIQDDILDTYGNEDLTGKEVGGDIFRGKKTFLYIHTLKALEDSRAEFIDLYKSSFSKADKLAKVKSVFDRVGVRSIAREQQDKYYRSAMDHLDQVAVDPNKKMRLYEVASGLIYRDS